MLLTELPQPLQEEFERTAHLLHEQDSLRNALIEAIELWLSQQHQKLTEAEAKINNRAFENLRSELEQAHAGKWIVIAGGKLQGAANSPEELNDIMPAARHRILLQVGKTRPKQVELGWQATFA
jgi:predicted phosphohydrolase